MQSYTYCKYSFSYKLVIDGVNHSQEDLESGREAILGASRRRERRKVSVRVVEKPDRPAVINVWEVTRSDVVAERDAPSERTFIDARLSSAS